ncbi:MAG: hypothetical protein IKB23_02060, partial [Clostridia bacterium]|nr:hypothetical protein [Clostridia bacterium]
LLIKYSKISDIRLAFKAKNYRICLDMCARLGRGHESRDDEIKLIMAECALAVAMEEVRDDRIRSACVYLDEAVQYSAECAYNTKHIDAAVGVLFDYLGELSPSVISENMDMDSFDFNLAKAFCLDNDFLKYTVALKDTETIYTFERESFYLHAECRRLMANGELDTAHNLLTDILKLDEPLQGVVLYSIFSDLEYCCRQLGNTKNARAYSEEKVAQLERILS